MSKLVEIVLAVMAGFGGVSGIIIICVRISTNFIAERLQKKYSLQIDKEFEKYKGEVGNKVYISKIRFDTEFGVYKELNKYFFEAVKRISLMVPSGVSNRLADDEAEKDRQKDLYSDALKATVEAQDLLNYNTIFIQDKIYDDFSNILRLCNMQLNAFERRWNKSYVGSEEEKSHFKFEDYARTDEINKKYREVLSELRTYINSLVIIE